jgi:hypothetical protein
MCCDFLGEKLSAPRSFEYNIFYTLADTMTAAMSCHSTFPPILQDERLGYVNHISIHVQCQNLRVIALKLPPSSFGAAQTLKIVSFVVAGMIVCPPLVRDKG